MKSNEWEKLLEMGFSADQIDEIREGVEDGVDVAVYAKRELLAIQMRQIRLGLKEKLPAEIYNDTAYDWFQMEEIREGLQDGVDVSLYASPSIPYDKMRQIRKGLQRGVDLTGYLQMDAGILRELRKAQLSDADLTEYVKDGYAAEQLEQIRKALEGGIEIAPYLSKELRGVSIAEIARGLQAGINVALYARVEYSWRQMRELRIGMENRVDITSYASPHYSWQQMQEIRLGLENGIDVSSYRSLMYTAHEMKRRRIHLQEDILEELVKCELEAEENADITITVSTDEMEVYIELRKGEKGTDKKDIIKALNRNGIVRGILEENIDGLIQKGGYFRPVLAARGQRAENGKDGWYEYFFRTDPERKPVQLPDGSVDYQNIDWFEMVKNGQKVACYHEAEEGINGFTVTGRELKAKRGKEKSVLTGKGFLLLPDNKTYISSLNGRIELTENQMEITRLLVLDDMTMATANVNFDGSVYVRGNIGTGTVLKAAEDIVVDGYVESALIECGGSIVLKQGANGKGSGFIKAGKGIVGRFFEAIRVQSGEDIQADYCLNCDIYSEGHIIISGGGTLAGGTAYCARGFRSPNVGNRVGISTYIKLGVDDKLLKEKQEVENRILEADKELRILKNAYADFQNKYPPEVRNTMELYLKVESAIYTKEEHKKNSQEENRQMQEKIKKARDVRMIVKGSLYEGVVVEINGKKWNSKDVRNVTIKNVDNKIAVYAN